MGQSRKRTGEDGKARYTAYYEDIRGKRRSAGTFGSQKEANRAWQRAEARLDAGRVGDPARGRQTLERYVEDEWFPNHVIEETTRESYTYLLNRYILPELGTMRMVEILPGHVREWILRLQAELGANPPTIKKCKVILDAALTTALNDQVTFLHAGKGVKTPPVATKPRRIITAEQYDRIHTGLGEETMQLLVETDIESGVRWGELTELRVGDLHMGTGVLTVSRVVVHLSGKGQADGPRFVVKDYPKDKEWRQLQLPRHLVLRIRKHIARRALATTDLLFQMPAIDGPQRRTLPDVLPDPDSLGLTQPNDKGRQYRHGTVSAYQNAKCRCRHCKNAVAAYRASRRAVGKDNPSEPRRVKCDGHIGGDWFRKNIWSKALEQADLGFHITPHGLRHAHASWLLAGGADLQVVKERLGHASITTTERYLHALPGADDSALAAMDAFRGRQGPPPSEIRVSPSNVQHSQQLADARKKLAAAQEDAAELARRFGEGRIGLDLYDIAMATLQPRIQGLSETLETQLAAPVNSVGTEPAA